MPDPKALVQPPPGDAHQCLTGSIRILPELCSMDGVFPWAGMGTRVSLPSLPVTGVEIPEPGRCYLKSLFCLCMEKSYLL